MSRFTTTLAAALATVATAGAAAAAQCDVCASGCDFDVIQDAIDASADGDTIWIGAGTYEESLTVDHHVLLLAQSSAMTPSRCSVMAPSRC